MNDIDPVSLAFAIAALLVGPKLAQYVGPYSVILLGSFAGCIFALRSREPSGRMSAGLFVVLLMILSAGLTVPTAIWVGSIVGKEVKWFLFPAAAMIAGIGERWFTVPSLLFDGLRDFVAQWAKNRADRG